MNIEIKNDIKAGIYSVEEPLCNNNKELQITYAGNRHLLLNMVSVAQAQRMIDELRQYISNKNHLKY